MYTTELAEKICRAISMTSLGLGKLCERNPDFPSRDTLNQWRYDYIEFSDLYAKAKLKQADYMAEEILDIADDGSNDWMEGKEGALILNSEHVQRSKLRIDTRKWLASKLLPKAYGDRVQNETTVIVKHEDRLKELE